MEFIIEEPDKKIGQEIKANWDRLAKPLDGLGEFEGLLARIGAILGSPEIDIAKKAVIVMCADNGIVAEGISQSGQEITAAVTENLGKRNTSVCKMAKAVGAEIFPVDIGVNTDRIFPGVISRKVKKGTNDFLLKPAMSEREAMQAVRVGMELVKSAKKLDIRCLVPERWELAIRRQVQRWQQLCFPFRRRSWQGGAPD